MRLGVAPPPMQPLFRPMVNDESAALSFAMQTGADRRLWVERPSLLQHRHVHVCDSHCSVHPRAPAGAASALAYWGLLCNLHRSCCM